MTPLCEKIFGKITYSQALALTISELTQMRADKQRHTCTQQHPTSAENFARDEFGRLDNAIQKNALFWLWNLRGDGCEWDRRKK